jgi:hypothetical protein
VELLSIKGAGEAALPYSLLLYLRRYIRRET